MILPITTPGQGGLRRRTQNPRLLPVAKYKERSSRAQNSAQNHSPRGFVRNHYLFNSISADRERLIEAGDVPGIGLQGRRHQVVRTLDAIFIGVSIYQQLRRWLSETVSFETGSDTRGTHG